MDAISSPSRHRGLLIGGVLLGVVSLVLGPLTAVPAVVIGVLLLRRSRRSAGVVVIALALVLGVGTRIVLFAALDGHSFRIPSGGMQNTLNVGDRFITTHVDDPQVGTIIAFHPPADAADGACPVTPGPQAACAQAGPETLPEKYVQRIVAVGGDRVKIVGGHVYRNGTQADEPFARVDDCQPALCDLPQEITVPAGHLYVMGDHRGASSDSRTWGPISGDAVVGALRLRYWPLGDFGRP